MMQEHIFERLAREKGISVEEMRAIISARIEKGWNDEDPVKREQWRKIPCAGEMPTPEVKRSRKNGTFSFCGLRFEITLRLKYFLWKH